MKKLSFIALALMTVFLTSCGGLGGDEANIDKSQIYGKWMTADSTYFEVYYNDGTGKTWDLKDDTYEEDAQTFTWEFDEGADDKFFQYQNLEIGGTVPLYCNILELTSTTFKYNTDALRATYHLVRAE